ncbi:MAG: hypothetical protein FWH04_07640 [Oscillospiraceae bacterium]|nr:hypothetical protein [Oscillospiraceae bacterium]
MNKQTEKQKSVKQQEMEKLRAKKKKKLLTSLSLTSLAVVAIVAGIFISSALNSDAGGKSYAGNSGTDDGMASAAKNDGAAASNVLAINDIRSDPLSFIGEITLTGINVGTYPQDPKIFFVMDTEELLACKNMQCGAFQLPVIYKGDDPMPELADEVSITGSWVKYEENGQRVDIFEAKQIDVKRNVMNLLQ